MSKDVAKAIIGPTESPTEFVIIPFNFGGHAEDMANDELRFYQIILATEETDEAETRSLVESESEAVTTEGSY